MRQERAIRETAEEQHIGNNMVERHLGRNLKRKQASKRTFQAEDLVSTKDACLAFEGNINSFNVAEVG